jgi:hypothetical protein
MMNEWSVRTLLPKLRHSTLKELSSNMGSVNSLWAMAALCLLVLPDYSSSTPDYRSLGYGSGVCLMNLSEEDLENCNTAQLKEIKSQNVEELDENIPGHLKELGLKELKESDNKNLAKLIARRLMRQMEVRQPQTSAWLLSVSGLKPELWERVLLSMTIPLQRKDSSILHQSPGMYLAHRRESEQRESHDADASSLTVLACFLAKRYD